MKPQHFAFLAGTLVLVALVLLIPGGQQSSADKAAAPPERTVTVTGEGEVRVKPDVAQVSVGVWTHGASATDAEALNVAFVKQVQQAMVNAGADDGADVAQTALSTASYTDYTGATRISGFETRSAIKATVRSLGKVQAVVDAALAAGATSVESIVYTLDKPEDAKEAAMKAALANARVRAAAMVKVEGEKLGDPRSLEFSVADTPQTVNTPSSLTYRAQVRATFGY